MFIYILRYDIEPQMNQTNLPHMNGVVGASLLQSFLYTIEVRKYSDDLLLLLFLSICITLTHSRLAGEIERPSFINVVKQSHVYACVARCSALSVGISRPSLIYS